VTKKTTLVGNLGRAGAESSYGAVAIGETDLRIIEYRGQRVVTLAQVDSVHQRTKGTARKRFNDNKARLIEGEDFVKMSASEFRTRFPGTISGRATSDVTLMNETGYLMLVKSFTDDLAWQVQRKLVTSYFRKKAPEPAPAIAYSVGRDDTLTKAEQDQLRDALHAGASALPRDQQGQFLMRGWSKLKSHFKTGHYREIPHREFVEALSIVQRHAVEYLPAEQQPSAIGYTKPEAIATLIGAANALSQVLPSLAALALDGKGHQALTAPKIASRSAVNAPTTRRKAA
jgi:hypothetical protein